MKNIIIALLAILPAIVPAQTVAWTFQGDNFSTGTTSEVKFSATGFTDISTFQFTLKWDTAYWSIHPDTPVTLTGILPGLGAGCFTWWGKPGVSLKPGEIRVAYTSTTGKTLAPGAHVFSLRFVAKKPGTVCQALSHWIKSPLWPNAWKGNLDYVPLTVACYTPPAPAKATNAAATDRAYMPPPLVDMQVAPNPLTDSAQLNIFLEKAGPVLINVYDAAGYVVHGSRHDHPGGSQRYDIVLPEAAPGTYFITVQTPAGRLIEKVQKI